jgi:hypothetical protein
VNPIGSMVCERCGEAMAATIEHERMFVCANAHSRFVTIREIEEAEARAERLAQASGLPSTKAQATPPTAADINW